MLIQELGQVFQVAAGSQRFCVSALDFDAHSQVVGQYVSGPVCGLDRDLVVLADMILQRFEEGRVGRFEFSGDLRGFGGDRDQFFADRFGQ